MFDGVARWWNGLELWLAQQWFPVQFVLVTAVLLPLCAALAWALHRVVDAVLDGVVRIVGRGRGVRRPGEGDRGAVP